MPESIPADVRRMVEREAEAHGVDAIQGPERPHVVQNQFEYIERRHGEDVLTAAIDAVAGGDSTTNGSANTAPSGDSRDLDMAQYGSTKTTLRDAVNAGIFNV